MYAPPCDNSSWYRTSITGSHFESMMKAWAQTAAGKAPDLLRVMEIAKPAVRPKDVLVKVLGAATNPVDGKIRATHNPAADDPPRVVGWDAAGVVQAIGADVKHFKEGDEVYFAGDVSRPGCFAELVAVDERIIARKPKNVDWATAATIPLTALTAYEALAEKAGAVDGRGKSLLVLNGAGGVGRMAIQLAKRLFKFDTVVGTASRPETKEYCSSLGADHVVNHHEDLPSQLAGVGLSNGVDVLFNCAEVDKNFEQMAPIVAPMGHVVLITSMERDVNISPFMWKRLSLHYEFMFSRILHNDRPEEQGRILDIVARMVEEGDLNVDIVSGQRYSIKELPTALALQDSGKAIGKIGIDYDRWP